MSKVTKCTCNFEICKFPQHIRNAHVDDQCVHGSGISHKISLEAVMEVN